AIVKELDRPLLGQLLEALLQLLALQGIVEAHAHEVLGREAGDALELDGRALAEAVTDAQDAGIPHAQDVARVGLVDESALLGHELHRAGEREWLAGAGVLDLHAAGELTRADA